MKVECYNTQINKSTLLIFLIDHLQFHYLQEFPPCSKLDPRKFGNQNSTLTEDHIKHQLDGLSVLEVSNNYGSDI